MNTIADLAAQLVRLEAEDLVRRTYFADQPAYTFKHALTQDVAYGTLLHRQRRDLHRAVARAYERLPDACEDELAPVLAYHYAEAGDDAQTLRYAMLAGDAAASRYAHAEAIAHYDRALSAAMNAGATTDQLIHLYIRRGRLLELSGRHVEAMASYESMARLAQERGDRPLKLASLLARAILNAVPTTFMDVELGEALTEEALATAQGLGDRAAEAKALWILSLFYRFRDSGKCVDLSERSLAIARELGLREQMALVLGDVWTAYWALGDLARAQRANAEAIQQWRELGNLSMVASALGDSANLSGMSGDWDAALVAVEETRRLGRQSGNLWAVGGAMYGSAILTFERGEASHGITTMAEGAALMARSGLAIAQASGGAMMANMHQAMGDVPAAIEHLRRGVPALAYVPEVARAFVVGAASHLKQLEGDLPGAVALLAEWTARYSRRNFYAAGMLIFDAWEAELALATGDTSRVIDLADELWSAGWRPLVAGYAPRILVFKARALLMESRPDEAYATLLEARAAAERLCWRQLLWQIYGLLASLERGRGDEPAAADMRARAQELIGYIVEHTDSPALRASFLARPDVMEIMA